MTNREKILHDCDEAADALIAKEAMATGNSIAVAFSSPAAPAKIWPAAQVGASVSSTRVGTEP